MLSTLMTAAGTVAPASPRPFVPTTTRTAMAHDAAWRDDAGSVMCGGLGNPGAVKRIHPGCLGGVT